MTLNVYDCISREEATRTIKDLCIKCDTENMHDYRDLLLEAFDVLPSPHLTLYGYDIQHLAFVATIMAKKGVTPEEAVNIFRDAKRMVDMVIDEMKETLVHEMKEMIEIYDQQH